MTVHSPGDEAVVNGGLYVLKIFLYSLGVLGVLAVLLAVLSMAAGAAFDRRVRDEVEELFRDAAGEHRVITQADLEGLPGVVQKWLERSGVLGKERAWAVRLKQTGGIRTAEGQPWMPFEAQQYYTVESPGFVWSVRAKAAPLVGIVGRDRYYQGKGHMLIKVLALKTVADSRGKEIDQGSMLRFLSEIMWFPTAALSEYIQWEPIDATSAKATMTYQGMTASGVFSFTEDGDVTSFVARRYYLAPDGTHSLETWSGVVSGHKEFDGVRIPSKADVRWNLEAGDFSYFNGEITRLEYNVPAHY